MKNVFYVLVLILCVNVGYSQSKNYTDLWDEVEKFEKDGLPKSALKVVEQIADKALADKNLPQEIKTLLYKSKYALTLEDDAQLNIIKSFKEEIANSEFPKKNILENMLAHLYWQYFNQHRWKFYNRTKTSEIVDAVDFRTWDLQTLFNEVHKHFQNSLRNGLMLQQEKLDDYALLINEGKKSKTYRPTLFDFLNHNALQFYKTSETQLTKPSYKFEIDDTKYILSAKEFANIRISAKDSTSLQLNALKIYQDLIQFHKDDTEYDALAEINIERLKFVHGYATFQNKDELFIKALETEKERLKGNVVLALYNFEIALFYFSQSHKYQIHPDTNPEKLEHRWKAKEALEICNETIKNFPKSEGAEKCNNLKLQIKQEALNIMSESHLPIETPSRLLVKYKNIETIDFQIFKISKSQHETLNKIYRKNEQLSFIKNLNAIHTWESKLKNEYDYQLHSTEIVLPSLDNGIYIIFSDNDKSDNEIFAYTIIQVTNIALVEKETKNEKTFQFINRNNGEPVANASVEITFYYRNNRTTKTNSYSTNSIGEVKITKDQNWYHGVNIKVSKGNDLAYFGEYYIGHIDDRERGITNYQGFIFTDRSIYRPGQTVYFKGIAIKKQGAVSEVLSNQAIKATLYDVNGQEVKAFDFITNEFGSISGEFMLPESGLNGNFNIRLTPKSQKINLYAEHYFSVEEYKRPKFESSFKPVTETFRVNDSITVNGEALAYAGSFVSNSKVIFSVHRKVEYPDWYFWYRPWLISEPQEIAHGETFTNNKGEFEITFKALPDTSVDKSGLPVFIYEVNANVTDINGETRIATTLVNVGYHALIATIQVEDKLDKSKGDHAITIETNNLNDEFVPTKGTIQIYKLKAPEGVLRDRPWPAPDYQTLSKDEFKKLFPHDAYQYEHDPKYWDKKTKVFETDFNTGYSKKVDIENIKNWESGIYLITLEAKDKFGQTVKDEARTTIYSDNDKLPADNQLFEIRTDKSTYNIEDNVLLTLGASAKDLNVTIMVEKDHKIVKKEVLALSNNNKTLEIPVEKGDLGGFAIHYSFAAFNAYKSGTLIINVPYPKTDLAIETITFRDKLQPNSEQSWEFKIKGPKGDKVSAEILASMYDASLDQFKDHDWAFNPFNNSTYQPFGVPNAYTSFGPKGFRVYLERLSLQYPQKEFDEWNWHGFYFGNMRDAYLRKSLSGRMPGIEVVEEQMESESMAVSPPIANMDMDASEDEVAITRSQKRKDESEKGSDKNKNSFEGFGIRKNLQETAFFFPKLKTDENGCVSFSFTSPESLTQWKLQLLAHTKNLENAVKSFTTVTQKELMVLPNPPRFLREGDKITISTKISNLSNGSLNGTAILQLTDVFSGKSVDVKFSNASNEKPFKVAPEDNTTVSWILSIPTDTDAVQYKIMAKAGDFSDGEQNALPVLSNRMLVTETLPMWVKSNEKKTFILDKLKTVSSTTIKHHKLSLEITSNPAWYAVQALPYLMEYPYDCNEQIFARYYANSLASQIASSNPRIQAVFNQWKSSNALISNLEKNEDLKSILIHETPWLRDAQSETEQKKRIALLFDLNKMNNELQTSLNKLKANQMSSGAWSWFKGGYENRFITQHIVSGFGHLKKLNILEKDSERSLIENAISYLDQQFLKEYNDIKKYDANVDLSKDHLTYLQLHYLYTRSLFPEISKTKEVEEIIKYYQTQIDSYWLKRSLYAKGLMALVSHRNNQSTTANKILNSLIETSITSEELGMYWKENKSSWHWYQAPIETQALMIETFSEVGSAFYDEMKNVEYIDNLKIWLLKHKQTNSWKTTKATSEAVYALLLRGSDWLSVTDMLDISIGNKAIEPSKLEDVKVEAGTGYFKTSWTSTDIKPEMAEVRIVKKGKGIAWGALYWQYFEDLDKITFADSPLSVKKFLFLKKNSDRGEELSKINNETSLKVGDLVRVRIEIRTDRDMEFIHLKDMRAAGLEPINVLSQYKWQDGLGYYESTKDASTNFFFDYLPKGIYVFEYDLRVNNAGNMSNGITTLQSMYGPEFSSHSKAVRIKIDN